MSARILTAASLALMVALAVGAPATTQASGTATDATPVQGAKALGSAFATVAERAASAVVRIQVELEEPVAERIPQGIPFGFPGPIPRGHRPSGGQGTGFVIESDGLILTNAHVVHEAARIAVHFQDGRVLDGEVVGADEKSDVAVVKVDAKDLPRLELADSDRIRVGEWVVAIGSPFGLSQSVTAGIVSAKGRNRVGITDYEDFIQTDAAINPGNSGGPLLDLDGRVVGMNAAIFSRSGGSMGIGFAIPANILRQVQAQIREYGSVAHGFLGVGVQDLTPDLASSLDLEGRRGVVVTEVVPDSAADEAELEVGDVVTAIESRPIDDAADFRNHVGMHRPGATIGLTVVRDGTARAIHATLRGRGDAAPEATATAVTRDLGLEVRPLTDEVAEALGLEGAEGVVVTDVDPRGLAARSGLRPGMVVVEADRRPVETVKDLEDAIEKAKDAGRLLLRVTSRAGSLFLVLKLR